MIVHASAPLQLGLTLDHSPNLPLHLSDRVAEEALRPVLDAPELIHFEAFEYSAFFPSLDEVKLAVFGRNLFIGDKKLKPAKQMLGVSLYQELNAPITGYRDEEIGQRCLSKRM